MRICLVTNEVFGLGRFGGFGQLTRVLGRYLSKMGVKVFVVSWRTPKQREVERMDGMTILSFPYAPSNKTFSYYHHMLSYLQSMRLYRMADADIYHSIENLMSSYVALKAMPDRKHVVWFQDPYDEEVYRKMSLVDEEYEWNSGMRIRFYSTLPFLRAVCNRADALFTQARSFVPMVKRLFRPKKEIFYLPNPVEIPETRIKKSCEPTVCFLGRWDPQKRVERFFHLARKFPKVRFVAMGKSHDENVDAWLRKKYGGIPNLEMTGLVSEEEKRRLLAESWILVNTSVHEGLPISFLEALAHRTALLSYENPDEYVSRFGYHVREDSLECLGVGLEGLLKDDLWREKAEAGYVYVRENHDADKIIRMLVEIYKGLL